MAATHSGARIVARGLTLGAQPRRAVIGGTGLHPIVHAARWVPQQRAAELSRPAEHRTSTPGPRLGRADLTPPRRRTRGQASLALALAMRSDRPPPDPPLRLDVFVDADAGSPPMRGTEVSGTLAEQTCFVAAAAANRPTAASAHGVRNAEASTPPTGSAHAAADSKGEVSQRSGFVRARPIPVAWAASFGRPRRRGCYNVDGTTVIDCSGLCSNGGAAWQGGWVCCPTRSEVECRR